MIDNNTLEEYYIGEFVSISGNDSNAKIAHAEYPVKAEDIIVEGLECTKEAFLVMIGNNGETI